MTLKLDLDDRKIYKSIMFTIVKKDLLVFTIRVKINSVRPTASALSLIFQRQHKDSQKECPIINCNLDYNNVVYGNG